MINWQPFSTAPKTRVIYAYHNVIGIRKIKWEEWPNVYNIPSNWLTLPNDAWDNEKTFSKRYYSSWTHWCEVSEIVPPRARSLNKTKSHMRNYIDHFQDDVRRG